MSYGIAAFGVFTPRVSNLVLGMLTLVGLVLFCAIPLHGGPTRFTGPDALWRSRETLVFHLMDRDGGGFSLDVAVRDMNTYHQGSRPAMIWVVGPSGKTLVRHLLDDDGIVSGNALYHDGIPDVYQDFRYREWHRVHSPGGYPPGKKRSPFLDRPQDLFARHVEADIADDGAGLYRVILIGSWDHWFSVTPSRPLPAAIHPGPGPLYLHGGMLSESYIYVPENTQEIGFTVSEEIQPYNWKATLETLDGRALAETEPRTFYNYAILRQAEPGAIYRMRLQGQTTGACLHLTGLPALMAPDAETAALFRGGTHTDDRGRVTFHGSQRRIFRYLDTLEPDDFKPREANIERDIRLSLDGRPRRQPIHLSDIALILVHQDLDPNSPTYGQFLDTGDERIEEGTFFWNQKVDLVARVAGMDHPDNPYYGDPALVRRVLLCRAYEDLVMLTPYFWFGDVEGPRRYTIREDSLWGTPYRSQWFPMHDAKHSQSLAAMNGVVDGVIPDDALSAWRGMFEQWVVARTLLSQGEATNQWASALRTIHTIRAAAGTPLIDEILAFQLKRLTTKGNEGRVGPDPTPFAVRGGLAYTYAADSGYCGAGYMSDGLGHDAQYNHETVNHLRQLYELIPEPGIVAALNDYYVLKTHLTLPKWGRMTRIANTETVSPTDSNHRTRYYTHQCGLGNRLRPKVVYGPLWSNDGETDLIWPALEKEPFVRNLDNEFFFVNTPSYYSIVSAGQANYDWTDFKMAINRNNSVQLVGYGQVGYGAYGRKSTKLAGISAVFVENCGPVLLAQNHNVMHSNTVWGRVREPVAERWDEGFVDPRVVSSGYAHPYVEFDEAGRVYTRVESMRYAPIRVTRHVAFADDAIEVTLNVMATGDLDMESLYEAIPFMVDRRRMNVYRQNLDAPQPFELPAIRTTETKPREADPETSGENPGLPEIALRAFDLMAADNDAGAAVVFDREYVFTQSQPVRYREVAAGVGSFNLKLPAQMRAGQSVTVRYIVIPHQERLAPERMAERAQRFFDQ